MASQLELRITGGVSNINPELSLGGIMSASSVSEVSVNNIFDSISSDEATAGSVEYRAIDVLNMGDETAVNVEFYMQSETTSESTSIDNGYDSVNSPHTDSWDGETIADETTAPASPSITFGHHLEDSRLSLPNIPAGEAVRLWFKRTLLSGAADLERDTAIIAIEYS